MEAFFVSAIHLTFYSLKRRSQLVFLFCAGFDQCDGSNETDGLQTHQLCQGEDDDNTPHWPPIQRGLPSALLPVSTHKSVVYHFKIDTLTYLPLSKMQAFLTIWLHAFCVIIPASCVDRTWECFVRSVEPAHLGPLLSHVIVALLPLIPLQPKETAAIIRFLILDNR